MDMHNTTTTATDTDHRRAIIAADHDTVEILHDTDSNGARFLTWETRDKSDAIVSFGIGDSIAISDTLRGVRFALGFNDYDCSRDVQRIALGAGHVAIVSYDVTGWTITIKTGRDTVAIIPTLCDSVLITPA